jgi:hypothetical protein
LLEFRQNTKKAVGTLLKNCTVKKPGVVSNAPENLNSFPSFTYRPENKSFICSLPILAVGARVKKIAQQNPQLCLAPQKISSTLPGLYATKLMFRNGLDLLSAFGWIMPRRGRHSGLEA